MTASLVAGCAPVDWLRDRVASTLGERAGRAIAEAGLPPEADVATDDRGGQWCDAMAAMNFPDRLTAVIPELGGAAARRAAYDLLAYGVSECGWAPPETPPAF